MINSSSTGRFTFAVAVLYFFSAFAFASFVLADDPIAQIQVSAEGSATLIPDMAVLNFTVLREAKTARAALDENSKAMAKVMAALRKRGIADKDLQTANFSIAPNYIYPQNANNQRGERQLVGYSVRNGLTVRVRDIAQVGAILDQAVTLGVNEGGDINFTNADFSAAEEQARRLAVKAAMAKAETLASAAGVKLGRVLSISEHQLSVAPKSVMMASRVMADTEGAAPIAVGENSYQIVVNLSVAIAKP